MGGVLPKKKRVGITQTEVSADKIQILKNNINIINQHREHRL